MLLCQSPAPQNFLNATIFSQGLPMWVQEFKPLLLVPEWCLFPSILFNWQVSAEVVDFRQKRLHPQGNTCKNPSWARKQPAVGTACLKKASQEACGFSSACPETVYQQLAVFRLHNRTNIFHKLECKQCFAIRESALLYCSPHFLSNALTNEKKISLTEKYKLETLLKYSVFSWEFYKNILNKFEHVSFYINKGI